MIPPDPTDPTVKLYLIDFEIDGTSYGAHIPARGPAHAARIAAYFCGTVIGTDLEATTTVSATELTAYIDHLTGGKTEGVWSQSIIDQLAAFLADPRPLQPLILGEH